MKLLLDECLPGCPTLLRSVRRVGSDNAREHELTVKIGAKKRDVILSQAADQFAAKVVRDRCYSVAVALVVGRTALVDVFFEPIVQIFVLAAFGDFGLVV
jgi:hypothetical protein